MNSHCDYTEVDTLFQDIIHLLNFKKRKIDLQTVIQQMSQETSQSP